MQLCPANVQVPGYVHLGKYTAAASRHRCHHQLHCNSGLQFPVQAVAIPATTVDNVVNSNPHQQLCSYPHWLQPAAVAQWQAQYSSRPCEIGRDVCNCSSSSNSDSHSRHCPAAIDVDRQQEAATPCTPAAGFAAVRVVVAAAATGISVPGPQHMLLHTPPQQQPQHQQQQEQPPVPQQHLQEVQEPQQQPQAVPFNPATLPISDRVKLLRNNAAARRRGRPRLGGPANAMGDVIQHYRAAGLSTAAHTIVLQHIARSRVSSLPEILGPFIASYLRLAGLYGEPVVLEWLKKAPPIIRCEAEVPSRLSTLQCLLGDVRLDEALALTKRCPQVLGVSSTLMTHRLQLLCQMLGLDEEFEGPVFLAAAPALLGMQPQTLEVKLQQLRGYAASHPNWAAACASFKPKSLAILLTYSLERQLRLAYAVDKGIQGRVCMNTMMAWSKSKMLQEYPDFEEWCHLHKQQEARAAAAAEQQQDSEEHLQQPGHTAAVQAEQQEPSAGSAASS